MRKSPNARKLIAVSKNTYADLCKLGGFGDTFDDIISRLIDKKQQQGENGAGGHSADAGTGRE